jgi:hypothetical protein
MKNGPQLEYEAALEKIRDAERAAQEARRAAVALEAAPRLLGDALSFWVRVDGDDRFKARRHPNGEVEMQGILHPAFIGFFTGWVRGEVE